jgi:3-oxoacyl-[acyl-carrier-protein] synthase II
VGFESKVHCSQLNLVFMEVVVTGIGLSSALGNLTKTWKRLLSGESALYRRQPFVELVPRPLGLIADHPSNLLTITHQIVADAMIDAGLTLPLNDCGVVVGSSRAQQAQWETLAKQLQTTPDDLDLTHWLETLPHAAAIATARYLGTEETVLAPMAACATGLWAIAQAWILLQTGQCQRVIAGAVEAPITPLTLTGFQQMGALAETGVYPFDRHRQGLALGEGGAVLVLETAELAKQRSAKVYGRVLGFGLTADGYHVSAPDPVGWSAISAVKHCLDRSCLEMHDIDYIHAHGTATQLNDRNEARLIQHLFPAGVPVSSTKGATGHTIGASGAIGAAFCLMALEQQQLPPCIGLQQPEFELDLITAPRSVTVRHSLCFSFGFGGQNAVVAFGS